MTVSNVPLVSVLLPVYNGERYLVSAVESVLRQTFGDFELLILDDGSTDGTARICERLAARDARVHVRRRENRGLVPTLNELIAMARGDLLARMDADDLCLPERFARQIDFLCDHPDVVCVGSDVEMIDEAGRLLTHLALPLSDADIQEASLSGHTSLFHPAVMMRAHVVRQVGGYRDEFYTAEDLDLWLRLGEAGRLANLPDALLRYRLHSQSMSGRNLQKQQDAARRSCAAAWERRGLTGRVFTAGDGWRPGKDARSRLKYALRFGWWAFGSGQRRTSMHYALRAVAAMPWSAEGWRLALCALLKRMPERSALGQERPR